MRTYFVAVLTLAVLSPCQRVTASSCSAPSSTPPSDSTGTEQTGLFLDTTSRVTCNGIATAWHYCYSFPASVDSSTLHFAADISLYRENAGLFGIVRWYERINHTHVSIDLSAGGTRNFANRTCETVDLRQQSREFNVSENDIVGVCIYQGDGTSDDNEAALVAVTTEPELQYNLRYLSTSCTGTLARTSGVWRYSTVSDHALNASLEIEPFTQSLASDTFSISPSASSSQFPSASIHSTSSSWRMQSISSSQTSSMQFTSDSQTSSTQPISGQQTSSTQIISNLQTTPTQPISGPQISPTQSTSGSSAQSTFTSQTSLTQSTSGSQTSSAQSTSQTSLTQSTSGPHVQIGFTQSTSNSQPHPPTMPPTHGTSSLSPVTTPMPSVPDTRQIASNRPTSVELPLPTSTQAIQYLGNGERRLGTSETVGIILGTFVAVLVLLAALVGLCACTKRKKFTSKCKLSKCVDSNHHRPRKDHFIMISDETHPHAEPYEEPTHSQKWKGNVHVLRNPCNTEDIPYYAEASDDNTAYYIYADIPNGKAQDDDDHIDITVYPKFTGQYKNLSKCGEDSMPCEYSYNNAEKNVSKCGEDSMPSDHYYNKVEKTTNEYQESLGGYIAPAMNEEGLYDQFEKQKLAKIPRREIIITGHLGSGQFGNVGQGVWSGAKGIIDVAVKRLATGAPKDNRVKLLQEAAIMGQFFHPNVIQLLGVVVEDNSVMVVMELCARGDLKKYLITMNPNPGQLVNSETNKILISFSQQITFGMQYLASKGFVHRDVAARNILVADGNIVKIADFGMSRDLVNDDYYVSQGGKIPIKWTAPEAANYRKYSTASDVWSYGCLLYEIWSMGCQPFKGCSNPETLEKVGTGYRLPPPPGCPRMIYKLMIQCWHPNSSSRPTFRDVLLQLMEPESIVLAIPEDDLGTHQLAGVLGAPLEAGEKMYGDLQCKYFTTDGNEDSE